MENELFLVNKFRETFGYEPTHYAFAPGRTNLIGEHTDYNNCPVLPFAVDLKISGCFAKREDKLVRIIDVNPDHGSCEFPIENPLPPFETGSWGNYPKAAIQAIMADKNLKDPCGYDCIIHSTIPSAGGMSSSSAFVVLSGLIFSTVNAVQYPKIQYSSLMAEAERYVGTQGGGMDQAASINGEVGKVLKIDFHPLSCRSFSVPQGVTFVVANTLIKAQKTKSALVLYNSKPAECRLAVALLQKKLTPYLKKPFEFHFLGDLTPENIGISEEERNDLIFNKLLKKEGYSYQDLSQELNLSCEEIAQKYCRMADGSLLPEPKGGFALLRRTRHVLTEWKRVEMCAHRLEEGEVEEVGRLMVASHESCRDDGEFSCPELNALVEFCLKAGALGSRMTGAGYGGCTVSLVRNEDVDKFKKAIRRDYYDNYLKETHPEMTEEMKASAIFSVSPSQGASVKSL